MEKENRFYWSCRFCKKENASTAIYFVENNYKFAIEKNCKAVVIGSEDQDHPSDPVVRDR